MAYMMMLMPWAFMQHNLGQVLSQLLQSGVSEMPMLLMVYFQTDQFAQIETMARSILDMHVAIRKLPLSFGIIHCSNLMFFFYP